MRRKLLIIGGIVGLVVLWVAGDRLWSWYRGREIVEGYSNGTVIPFIGQEVRKGEKWSHVVPLNGGVTVTIRTEPGPYQVQILFSDEREWRPIGERLDYAMPTDIRVSKDHRYIFVRTSGALSLIFDEDYVYRFDLSGRQEMRRAGLDPRTPGNQYSGADGVPLQSRRDVW